jgi:hypothetical protein
VTINSGGRPKAEDDKRKNIVVTLRISAAQARDLDTRIAQEGFEAGSYRKLILAAALLGIAQTPVGEFQSRLRAILEQDGTV